MGKWSQRHFGIVQSVESNIAFGDVVYSHFCHRWFLRNRWHDCGASGLRGAMRWLDHFLHSLFEPWAFHRAKWVVSPSQGLARELCEEYPFIESKIRVIPNPVDLDFFSPPRDFDRRTVRDRLGFSSDNRVIAFVALGHFELKGLPLLLDALTKLEAGWSLVVVGGMQDLIDSYEHRVRAMGLANSVQFVGTQKDVRPYLWAADLFALPSSYEVFPLSALQAAAAGCPILVTKIHGVEEFLVDGESCLIVSPDSVSVLDGLRRFDCLGDDGRRSLGEQAQVAAKAYGLDTFARGWRDFYQDVASESTHG
jgi:glycosyltransferase involved in cell wall biosynthesis